MASPAQINANRLNAMKSTGPRTEAGKAASRLNALRHGADAELPIIPGEDPEALAELTRDYHDHYRPSGPEECSLVDTLIQNEWLKRRLLRIEAEMTNHLLAEMEPCANPLGALYASDTAAARSLDRIRRHFEAAQRAWFQALRRFDQVRAQSAEQSLDALLRAPLPKRAPEATAENWLRSESRPPHVIPAPPAIQDPRLALRL